MLTLADIPEWLDLLGEQVRQLGEELRPTLVAHGRMIRIPVAGTAHEQLAGHIALVESGMFRYKLDGKLIRFFTEFDIVGRLVEGGVVEAEFASELILLPEDKVFELLGNDKNFAQQWFRHQEMQLQLAYGLLSAHVLPQPDMHHEIRTYFSGDTIVKQGDASRDIYVMISGEADVSIDGIRVGAIDPNEIFGEIGFLINTPRSASVVASGECVVQVLPGADFHELLRSRPNVAVQLATTQARRISALNQRLIERLQISVDKAS